jgi:hypothetical protein
MEKYLPLSQVMLSIGYPETGQIILICFPETAFTGGMGLTKGAPV